MPLILGLRETTLPQAGCSTPPKQGAITAWAENATVHVSIDTAFTDREKQAIVEQLGKWSNVGGANVTFAEKDLNSLGPGASKGGNPILFITKQIPQEMGPSAQGETRGFSSNGRRGDSFIDINPG